MVREATAPALASCPGGPGAPSRPAPGLCSNPNHRARPLDPMKQLLPPTWGVGSLTASVCLHAHRLWPLTSRWGWSPTPEAAWPAEAVPCHCRRRRGW